MLGPHDMWTGRRFRLKQKVLAVIPSECHREDLEYIPEGEMVVVVRGPHPNRAKFVEVRWKDRDFFVFAVDLEDRGEEVKASAAAKSQEWF